MFNYKNEDIEVILNEVVDDDDFIDNEKKFNEEKEKGHIKFETQFNYAWCLTRSPNLPDMKKGILLLEDLAEKNPKEKRDYIYYLAIGNARVHEYGKALNYCKSFLKIEPNNQQTLALQRYIEKHLNRETVEGAVVLGGGALIVAGIVGLIGLAISKK